MKKYLLIILVCLSACKATVNDNRPHKIDCIDTRDGEIFYILGANIEQDALVTLNDACFYGIDNKGIRREMCKSHEVFMKCLPVYNN